MKKAISFFLLLVIIFSLSSCTMAKSKTSNTARYEKYLSKVEYSESHMPDLEQCGNYSSMNATYTYECFLFFDVYTVGLFLSYSESEYEAQKNNILSNYEFFKPDDENLKSDCNATVKNYNIQLVKAEYEYSTIKMGLLIGTDDSNCKICYLFYYDFDLDVMDDLDTYIENYFYLL